MAKIHTVEWTPGILANPVLERAMNANWYGVLPRWVRQKFGHVGTEMIGGVVGSDQDHHTAPYAITEEFVAVYRLHPLLPDDYAIRDHETGRAGRGDRLRPDPGPWHAAHDQEFGWSNLLYSFGTANPGAITLQEPPQRAQRPRPADRRPGRPGTLDILRDRERGVPRYNDFRERLRKPRIEQLRGPDRRSRRSPRRSATSTTATSTASTSRSGCSPSRCRPASASATRPSGSSS